jgi:hypothetical protein
MTSGTRRIVPVPDGAGKVERAEVLARVRPELRERADDDELGRVRVVAPDRERGAPVALARQRPVDVVLQPRAVPAVLDVRRVPGGLLVLLEQALADLGGADEPAGQRVVDQRRVAAPAVRIRVLVVLGAEEHPALAQVGDERRVGRLEEQAADQRDVVVEVAVGADRVDHLQALGAGDLVVLRAERGRHVHESGTGVGGDVVPVDDAERVSEALGVQELERPGVVGPDELGAGQPRRDLGALAEDVGDEVLGEDQVRAPPIGVLY